MEEAGFGCGEGADYCEERGQAGWGVGADYGGCGVLVGGEGAEGGVMVMTMMVVCRVVELRSGSLALAGKHV